jgi:branched-chain amino acid transport system substrate-binding protein
MEVAHKYGIPVVFAETWSNDITAKGYPEVFRIAPTVDYNARIIAEHAKEAGWQSVVYILEDTDYGRSQGEANKKAFESMGINDVTIIYADPKTEDFTPILQRIQQNPPDLLGGGVTGVGSGRVVKQACELGLAPTKETAMSTTVDAQYPEFWEVAGDCGKYILFVYLGLPESLWNDKTRSFMDAFEKRWEHQPGGPAMETYDAVYLLADAITKAGSTDPKAIIAALEDIKYTGTLGDFWFEYTSKNPVPADVPPWMWHQWPTPNMFMLQYTDTGQTVKDAAVVWPQERATGPIYTSP